MKRFSSRDLHYDIFPCPSPFFYCLELIWQETYSKNLIKVDNYMFHFVIQPPMCKVNINASHFLGSWLIISITWANYRSCTSKCCFLELRNKTILTLGQHPTKEEKKHFLKKANCKLLGVTPHYTVRKTNSRANVANPSLALCLWPFRG